MYKCKKCGREFEGNFCPDCGEKRPADKFCPKCGAELSEGQKFCPNCGFNHETSETPETTQTSQTTQNSEISPMTQIKLRRLYRILEDLPWLVMLLACVFLFIFTSEIFSGIRISFLDEWKYKDYSGIDGLDAVAGASIAIWVSTLIAVVFYGIFKRIPSFSSKSVTVFGRKNNIGFFVQFIAAAIILAHLIMCACGLSIIKKADEGLGILQSPVLERGLWIDIVSFVIALACPLINEFVILRRCPQARADYEYRAAVKEFSSKVPAPGIKEKPELYIAAVKHYILKNAALCCVFIFAAAIVAIVLRFVALNIGVIISPILFAVGIAVIVLSIIISGKQALNRIKTKNVAKMLKNGVLYKVICVLTCFITFYAYLYMLRTNMLIIILDIVCCIFAVVLSVLLFYNHSTLYYLFYGSGSSGRRDKAAVTDKKVSCNDEDFEKQKVAYVEYREYLRLMAIYNYKAHLYVRAKKKNAGDEKKAAEIAALNPDKKRVWLHKNGFCILVAAAVLLVICTVIVVATVGGTFPPPETSPF